jgi:hypothetical protein
MTPRGSSKNRRFGGTYRLRLQDDNTVSLPSSERECDSRRKRNRACCNSTSSVVSIPIGEYYVGSKTVVPPKRRFLLSHMLSYARRQHSSLLPLWKYPRRASYCPVHGACVTFPSLLHNRAGRVVALPAALFTRAVALLGIAGSMVFVQTNSVDLSPQANYTD